MPAIGTRTVSFAETLGRIREDFRRTGSFHGPSPLSRRLFWMFSPSIVSLALYRVSHYCYLNKMKFAAWPLYLFNLYLTGADIPPTTVIGRRCFLGHVSGSVLCCEIGDDATLFAAPAIGGGMGSAAGRTPNGLPVIGNDVMIGARAIVLGAVRIGDGCTIGASTFVNKDMAPGTTAVSRSGMVVNTLKRNSDYDGLSK